MTRRPASPRAKRQRTGATLGLALGGGAARGLAHIPMLEVLDELGLRPTVIAGTSIGAIVGAAYAAGMTGAEIREYALKLFAKRGELARRITAKWPGSLLSLWNPMTPAMFNAETLLEIVMPETLPLRFEDLAIPFLAVTTDFYAREEVVIGKGPLMPAVAASASLPALMKPVIIGERVLIDGGFVNPTPFDVVREHASISLAIDVTGNRVRKPHRTGMPNSLDAWVGAAQIALHSIVQEKLKSQAPDILIRPEVGNFAILDFYRAGDIMAAAEPAKEMLKRELDRALTRAEAS